MARERRSRQAARQPAGQPAGQLAKRGLLDRALLWLVPLCLSLFGLNALRFVLTGAPGVADVAHLAAIDLPLGQLLGWIAGNPQPDLTPAPARGAPLPLIVDWLLWRVDPFGIAGLRLAHLAMVLAALALLLRALVMRMDHRTAALAGLAVALSPRFVETVASLGPEPFVLALFCWQLAILLTRGKIGGREPLVMFAAVGAASGLCGPTGLVAAGSLFAAFVLTARDRPDLVRRLRHVVPALLAGALPLLLPDPDGAPAQPPTMRGLASFGLKLVAHNADMLLMPGWLLLLGGTGGLILLGLYSQARRLVRNGLAERMQPFALLLGATSIGLVLTLFGGSVLGRLARPEPTAPAWLGLLVTLLAAACFAPRLLAGGEGMRRLRRAAAGMMIAGSLVGAVSHQYRAEWFAAGPEAGLARALAAADGSRAIVYAGPDWGRAYFPHAWLAPGDADQWLLGVEGTAVHRILPGGNAAEPEPLAALDRYDALVLVRVQRRGWRDLAAAGASRASGVIAPASLDPFIPRWKAAPARSHPGTYWLTTQHLEKDVTY